MMASTLPLSFSIIKLPSGGPKSLAVSSCFLVLKKSSILHSQAGRRSYTGVVAAAMSTSEMSKKRAMGEAWEGEKEPEETIVQKAPHPSYAELRNTGLERSEALKKDLEWLKEQGHTIPEPSSPGSSYARYLEELPEKDPQIFIGHFYMVYFGHAAGGRQMGKKVAEMILNKKLLEFYKWEYDLSKMLQNVRDKLNIVASNWSREKKNHCLEEIEMSFNYYGEIIRLILS